MAHPGSGDLRLQDHVLRHPAAGARDRRRRPGTPARLTAAGHELGLHGYDHVRWHDRLFRLTSPRMSQEIAVAQHPFRSYAAAGLIFCGPGLAVQPDQPRGDGGPRFLYASDTRGFAPYFPGFGETVTPVLEIPTTLPTLDELLGLDGCRPRDFSEPGALPPEPERPQVLTIHAELEGGPFLDDFAGLLRRCRGEGVDFFRLEDWARELLPDRGKIPVAQVTAAVCPGGPAPSPARAWRPAPMIAAIIAAAGVGERMGHQIPKPYLQLAGKPILAHTLEIFEDVPEIREVTVVVHPEELDYCQEKVIAPYGLKKVLRLVPGGKERQDSVYNALKALQNEDDLEIVLVHDGVRPFVTPDQVRQVIQAARRHGGAVLGLPAQDTLKRVNPQGRSTIPWSARISGRSKPPRPSRRPCCGGPLPRPTAAIFTAPTSPPWWSGCSSRWWWFRLAPEPEDHHPGRPGPGRGHPVHAAEKKTTCESVWV